MKIKFASSIAELAGERECKIQIKKDLLVRDFISLLMAKYPGLKGLASYPYGFMIIKNGRYLVRDEEVLEDSDWVELIPPILGG